MSRPHIPSMIGQDDTSSFVILTGGLISRIDEADVPEISRWHWYHYSHKHTPYVRRHHYKTHIRLHRLIAGANDTDVVDHINGDTLDNRRANLRLCTRQQNGWNRRPNKAGISAFKGVGFRYNKWVAHIRVDGVRRYLGSFASEAEAAMAYDAAAALAFGSFAFRNFPEVSL